MRYKLCNTYSKLWNIYSKLWNKNILADRKKFQGEKKIFQGEKKKYPADIFAQKGKEERKQKEIPFVHSVFVLVENK